MKSNSFTLIETKNKQYPIIICSLEYKTLSDYILEVETILKEKSYSGKVLFDLLQSNGLNDRYYSLPFNGLRFEYNDISNKISLPKSIVELTNSFYIKNNDISENGILNKVQKLRISKQYAI